MRAVMYVSVGRRRSRNAASYASFLGDDPSLADARRDARKNASPSVLSDRLPRRSVSNFVHDSPGEAATAAALNYLACYANKRAWHLGIGSMHNPLNGIVVGVSLLCNFTAAISRFWLRFKP